MTDSDGVRDTNPVSVRDNDGESRFEAVLDGVVVGTAYYRAETGTIVFTHTKVDPSVGGRGVGGALARGALDSVRAAGLMAVPMCPFIAAYIAKHPDYLDLVPASARAHVHP